MNTQDKIRVMQAYWNGKPIEHRSRIGSDKWTLSIRDTSTQEDSMRWNWQDYDCRLRPSRGDVLARLFLEYSNHGDFTTIADEFINECKKENLL
jgi:hypothetical protein